MTLTFSRAGKVVVEVLVEEAAEEGANHFEKSAELRPKKGPHCGDLFSFVRCGSNRSYWRLQIRTQVVSTITTSVGNQK